ncbi:hypothetical protein M2263_003896 [Providencia alcalifaciens]|nr:hypothetical protein [Providencia alcalifaciens]
MASVITIAFEGWKAQEAASGKPVLLNEFVFANVPNLDPTKPIDRNEKLPPANQIVYRQLVNKSGLASENAVAYSVTLGAEVGDFDFNWIGLLNKESGTVAMITHAPSQKKLKTQNGQQGNVLIRSFLLEFNGAAEETQIKTSAETWQIDFTARLTGIDEMQRLINVDSYGVAAFFEESFEVTRSGEQFTVKKGLGYVGGLRGELLQNQILNNLRNTKVYADFSYQGNIVSQWHTVIKITAAATLNNYVDAAGFTHQVFAIANVDASGNVKDLRSMGALSDQELAALETRFKLDLSKKIDKANITHQMGNSTELVVSQQLLTSELGKKQPVGNYQPAGNYATSEALKNGLNEKVDKVTGDVETLTVYKKGLNYPVIRLKKDEGSTVFLEAKPNSQAAIAELYQRDTNGNVVQSILFPRATGTTMLVGDFGIGKASYEEKGVGERNESRFIQYGSTLVATSQGYPGAGGGIQVSYTPSRRAQIFMSRTPEILYYRFSNIDGMDLTTQWKEIYSTANTTVDRNGNLKASGAADHLSDCRVGCPLPWPQSTPPTGYLICNGQTFNKTTYPLLALAYPSGVLPDLRGEFIRGLDAGRNIDNGRAVLSEQSDENQEHDHNMILKNANGSGSSEQYALRTLAINVSNATYTTKKSGGKESRPRNIAFLYIVRAA